MWTFALLQVALADPDCNSMQSEVIAVTITGREAVTVTWDMYGSVVAADLIDLDTGARSARADDRLVADLTTLLGPRRLDDESGGAKELWRRQLPDLIAAHTDLRNWSFPYPELPWRPWNAQGVFVKAFHPYELSYAVMATDETVTIEREGVEVTWHPRPRPEERVESRRILGVYLASERAVVLTHVRIGEECDDTFGVVAEAISLP